jgi:hypothetical protein
MWVRGVAQVLLHGPTAATALALRLCVCSKQENKAPSASCMQLHAQRPPTWDGGLDAEQGIVQVGQHFVPMRMLGALPRGVNAGGQPAGVGLHEQCRRELWLQQGLPAAQGDAALVLALAEVRLDPLQLLGQVFAAGQVACEGEV